MSLHLGQAHHAEQTSRADASRGSPGGGFVRPRWLGGVRRKGRKPRSGERRGWIARCGGLSWLRRARGLRFSGPGWWPRRPAGWHSRRPARQPARSDLVRARGSLGRVLFQQCSGLRSPQPGRHLSLYVGCLRLSAEYGPTPGLSTGGRHGYDVHLTAFCMPRWIWFWLHLRVGHLCLPLTVT